ncbi:MAG: glycoside hydrolase family 99-like domain-containing protein [Muribaculaceae bacterium]|nr:glycoside hydrolase family 99-like domain-containing protein [Muribaculaceae bacterium]
MGGGSKVIAFYLPQYHPTPDNERWWGKGFTEWTNVAKAKPLFRGHYQPKIPADLGFYDLRLSEIREAQAELAREAGIYGFCYYHYWFGNGKQELELPFNEVLRTGKPDFPFMLCWANESWHKKFWNKDGVGTSKEILIEQTYPGEKDIVNHFYHLLPAFKDPRYIRIYGKPAFMIYMPENIPSLGQFIKKWEELGMREGLGGIYFIGHLQKLNDKQVANSIKLYENNNFNAINLVDHYSVIETFYKEHFFKHLRNKIERILLKRPITIDYKNINKRVISKENKANNVYPTLIPNWDHTPRSGKNGRVYTNVSPKLFAEQVSYCLDLISDKDDEDKIIFLKSWNEWGEGNYMEPDLEFGHGFLKALKNSLKRNQAKKIQ